MTSLDVNQKFFSPYHSQSNGMLEQFNRFLRTALRCHKNSDAWFDHLGLALKKSNQKTKSSLYSRYYDEASNERRGPFPLLSVWATQLRRNVATVASRWRHCADLTSPRIEPQTSQTDSVRLTTELTGRQA